MAHKMTSSVIFVVLCFLFLTSSSADLATYNVLSYGAKPNDNFDSTQAFLAAWKAACSSSASPATIYVPRGTFLLQNVAFLGDNCKNSAITIRIDGTLVAPQDYNVMKSAGNWILFENVNGVSIYGGVLDGRGAGLWACKKSGKKCPVGTTTLRFERSQNIAINGLTSLNSEVFHIVISGCNNVRLQGVTISASGHSPNTDGIHVHLSSFVAILNSRIGTGDDCISIAPGTTNLVVENVACGPGHGISIGSLGWELQEPGVQNVTVKYVSFRNTQNGVRIKSWGRMSNGFAKNIVFQHATMNDVQNPIVIDQDYCPNRKCPRQASGVQISDVTYQDIHGTSATEVAVKFDCSWKRPCTGIKLQDVWLSYKNQGARASCKYADGTATGVNQPSSCLS